MDVVHFNISVFIFPWVLTNSEMSSVWGEMSKQMWYMVKLQNKLQKTVKKKRRVCSCALVCKQILLQNKKRDQLPYQPSDNPVNPVIINRIITLSIRCWRNPHLFYAQLSGFNIMNTILLSVENFLLLFLSVEDSVFYRLRVKYPYLMKYDKSDIIISLCW